MMAQGNSSPVSRFLGLHLLGREDEAHEALQEITSADVPYSLATLLSYQQFDISRFPDLDDRLSSQGLVRSAPNPSPFNCP
jgi:hypothetical protein